MSPVYRSIERVQDLHEESRVCHQMGDVGVALADCDISRDIEAQ